MKINLEELKKRDKYIFCQRHPDEPLIIWNYTHACQYDKAWDEYTKMCRGLITNLDGRVLARPFSKFFNLNESEESKIENLPAIESEIYEKLDGSFLIQYYSNYDKDDNKVYVATRGSVKSD